MEQFNVNNSKIRNCAKAVVFLNKNRNFTFLKNRNENIVKLSEHFESLLFS